MVAWHPKFQSPYSTNLLDLLRGAREEVHKGPVVTDNLGAANPVANAVALKYDWDEEQAAGASVWDANNYAYSMATGTEKMLTGLSLACISLAYEDVAKKSWVFSLEQGGDASGPTALAQAAHATWFGKYKAFVSRQRNFNLRDVLDGALREKTFCYDLPKVDGELVNITSAIGQCQQLRGDFPSFTPAINQERVTAWSLAAGGVLIAAQPSIDLLNEATVFHHPSHPENLLAPDILDLHNDFIDSYKGLESVREVYVALGEEVPVHMQCLLAALRARIRCWMQGWDLEPRASLLAAALTTRHSHGTRQAAVEALSQATAAVKAGQAAQEQAAAVNTKLDHLAKVSLAAKAAAQASEKKASLVCNLATAAHERADDACTIARVTNKQLGEAVQVIQSLNDKVEQLSSEVKSLKRQRQEEEGQESSGRSSKRPFQPKPSPLGMAPQLQQGMLVPAAAPALSPYNVERQLPFTK
ncbi:hemolysin secretion D [Chlorella sorokiniana]|uniref:Hemolysin secretion D n=1 Tax=Chlorella sorokiniana TaxID=3076 RepID=A0A2P6TCD0_CHLSO|nr:hemolysin secretion D [Chlorella sorokiniana]|eukprot:PRW20294.1 hemolysin secretion D [Chlorella sorokiniana]